MIRARVLRDGRSLARTCHSTIVDATDAGGTEEDSGACADLASVRIAGGLVVGKRTFMTGATKNPKTDRRKIQFLGPKDDPEDPTRPDPRLGR